MARAWRHHGKHNGAAGTVLQLGNEPEAGAGSAARLCHSGRANWRRVEAVGEVQGAAASSKAGSDQVSVFQGKNPGFATAGLHRSTPFPILSHAKRDTATARDNPHIQTACGEDGTTGNRFDFAPFLYACQGNERSKDNSSKESQMGIMRSNLCELGVGIAPPPLRVDAKDGGGCYVALLPVSTPPRVPPGLAREEEDDAYEAGYGLELTTAAASLSVPSRGAPGLREDADEAVQLVSPPHGGVGSAKSLISTAIASVYERLSRTFSVRP
ncbi:hypothetical protein E2562_037308 [Oryza meyeriana var. granulata]|uniref:Uncharacterized protein n=1 Tax=Oryza meyeriana var. granulata TaxID=110450 RepID=A0A6G1E8Q1_9ORYZ|nr:hypothetical protein E2562_037308 [Oryza meyeriana var. granulata]